MFDDHIRTDVFGHRIKYLWVGSWVRSVDMAPTLDTAAYM